MNKKLYLIPFLILILISNTLVFGDTITFTDTNGSEWYYNDLVYLAEQEIISGKADGSFDASGLLTKDALIKTLVVAKGYDPGNADGYWAQNYIDQANALGWLEGILSPPYNTPINRYESCALIVNALDADESIPYSLSDYIPYISDYESMPSAYQEVVLKVYSLGIITGYPDKSFSGSNTLTRAEMTAILSRFINPDNRKVPMNPLEISKVSSLSQEAKVFEPLFVTFDGQQILYNDSSRDIWIPINSSGLLPSIARISEDAYIDVAYTMNDITEDSVITSYSYNNFYMYIEKEGVVRFSYYVVDGDNTIQLSIPDLYEDPFGTVDASINQALLAVLKNIDPITYGDIYDFIITKYAVNTSPSSIKFTEVFNDKTVTVSVAQDSVYVDILMD